MASAKKFMFTIFLVIVLFGIFYLLYLWWGGFGIKCPLPEEIESIDSLQRLRLYELKQNGISYFECSENKERIMQVCLEEKTQGMCNIGMGTVYMMFLHKTRQTDVPHISALIMLIGMAPETEGMSEETLKQEITKILQNDEYSAVTEDMNLFKGIVPDSIVEEEQDGQLRLYYSLIIKFREAKSIEDCEGISRELDKEEVVPENETVQKNVFGHLIVDACKMSFSNKESICRQFINREIQACEEEAASLNS